jgi:hypothetical protein
MPKKDDFVEIMESLQKEGSKIPGLKFKKTINLRAIDDTSKIINPEP